MEVQIRRSLRAASLALLLIILPQSVAGAHGVQLPRRAFVPVFTFHHVKWLKPSDDAIERGLTVQPDLFAADMRYLASSGHHVVTTAAVVSYLRGGASLPAKPVVLTFDDGYADVYTQAYPYLIRHHVRATFFIVPGFLNTPRYLTWSQVATMAGHGMDIEAHSLTHPDLTTLSVARAVHEIAGSRAELQSRLHQSVRIFAYPYGAFNAGLVAAVRRAGYIAAFTTKQGWWQSSGDLLTLPRVYPDSTFQVFKDRLAGYAS